MSDATAAPGNDPSDSFWEKLRANEPETWKKFLSTVMPLALKRIRHELELGTTNENDAAAALYSAFSSFRRRFLEGELGDPENPEDLAVQLVRIAHNRFQRAKYRNRKWGKEVDGANMKSADGEWVPFDPVDSSDIERAFIEKEFGAYLDQFIHQLLEEECAGNPQKQLVLRAYVENSSRSQEEIARLAGIWQPQTSRWQSKVSRWIKNFNARIRFMLEERDEE